MRPIAFIRSRCGSSGMAWPDGNDQLAFPLVGLGRIRLARDNPAGAEPLFMQALEERGDLPPGHWAVVEAKTWLARALISLDRFNEAEQLLLEALAEDESPAVAASRLEERGEDFRYRGCDRVATMPGIDPLTRVRCAPECVDGGSRPHRPDLSSISV